MIQFSNRNDSESSRPKKRQKKGHGDEFNEDDPVLKKFIKIVFLKNILKATKSLDTVNQYLEDMNHIYMTYESSVCELINSDKGLDIEICKYITRLVKLQVGYYLFKFKKGKFKNKKEFVEIIDDYILELGNLIHPKMKTSYKNHIKLCCEIYASPEKYYKMISSVYTEKANDDFLVNDETLDFLTSLLQGDEEEEDDEDDEYEDEDEDEEEDEEDEDEDEDYENLKDSLMNKGIFLKGNRIYVGKEKHQKLDKLDKKFLDLNQQNNMNMNSMDYFKKLEVEEKNKYIKTLEELNKFNSIKKPLMMQVMDFNTTMQNKNAIIKKIKQFDEINPYSSEFGKLKKWVDMICRVPFGKNHNYPVKATDKSSKIKNYFNGLNKTMDNAIFGHDDAKKKILQIVAQSIVNPNGAGNVIAIEGPPGNGKTSLVKDGICKALGRPFVFIPLGGATDACFLEGHDYTYEGSNWGRIVDVLVTSKCMNPVIYFDELDKVSQTAKGEEIINILMHLTDSTQNSHFNDKYFAGIDFDLSKALFIFSFNDVSKINHVLLDRMFLIKTKGFKQADKLNISYNYLLPNLMDRCGFNKGDIVFEEEAIKFIIDNYTCEGGVRKLKENLLEIIREINLRKLNKEPLFNKRIKDKVRVTKKMIIKDIFKKKHIYNFVKIHHKPRIGCANGMYASSNGDGGITMIETSRIPSQSTLSLELTGSQGKVMMESMKVAKSIAWSLLPNRLKSKLHQEWTKNGNMGIHIHCPEGATPKDGPSAGAAITVALVSLFTKIPVNNKIALTGEINLNGQVMEIGGLDDKVLGAKKAGVELVLCPRANKKDLEKIRASNYNPEDDNFKIVMVDNIWDVLNYTLIDNHKCMFNKF